MGVQERHPQPDPRAQVLVLWTEEVVQRTEHTGTPSYNLPTDSLVAALARGSPVRFRAWAHCEVRT